MPRGKVFQDGWAIVTDCCQLDAVLFKSRLGTLQLHELRLAEGSPIRGAKEKKNGSPRAPKRLIGLLSTELISQSEGRRSLANPQSDGLNRMHSQAFILGENESRSAGKEKNRHTGFHISLPEDDRKTCDDAVSAASVCLS